MKNTFFVYILTNAHNNVLYVGSTGNLKKRVYLHRNRLIPGFSKKYNVSKLAFLERCCNEQSAFKRELQIKSGTRAKKIKLIESMDNPWQDIFDQLI